MSETLTIDFNKPVPIFPLNRCALLPHATIALHVFEQRYIDLTNNVLDSSGLLSLATFEDRTLKTDNSECNAPLRDWVCVGYVVRHEKRRNGNYTLLVQGICRAKIIREVEGATYRKAILRPAAEAGAPAWSIENEITMRRENIEQLIGDPTLRTLAPVNAIHNWMSTQVPTAVVVDLAILTLCTNIEQRYQMLAETDLTRRADWLDKHLRHTRSILEKADSLGAAVSDEGLNLN